MIKLINIITQNIILLGCCAISIFILFVLITFIKIVTKQKTSAVKTGIFSFNLIVVGTYTLNLQIL